MPTIYTVCGRDCYDSCTFEVTTDVSGTLTDIKADPNHPITRGFACPRSAKDLERLEKNRIDTPCLRVDGRLKPADWHHSLDLVSQKLEATLKNHGPEAVLYLDYAGNNGLFSTNFPQRLWHAMGATKTDGALCNRSGHDGLSLHFGQSFGEKPEAIRASELVVFWGFNAAVSAPHIWRLALEARKQKNTKIVVIDPVKNQTAKQADLWLQPVPGGDIALAYGIINRLIKNNGIDNAFVETHTKGFEQLKEKAIQWPLERVEKVSGVSSELVIQLTDFYNHHKPGLTMIGIGLQKCDNGAGQVRAISLIGPLLGRKRGFFYGNSSAFFLDKKLISGESLTNRPPEVVHQVDLGKMVKSGRFKFVFVNSMNPALTLPDQDAFRKGLSRPDLFLCVHETHWTGTTSFADVVLPALTFLEKEDLLVPWTHNYLRISPKLVQPKTGGRTEIEVMRAIARRIGITEAWVYEDPWPVLERAFESALEKGDFQLLKKGKQVLLKTKPRNQYDTPSGKIELFASNALQKGFSPLPEQIDPGFKKGEFTLLTSATTRYTSTQFQDIYGPIPAVITIHPVDAGIAGVKEGDDAAIVNQRGHVKVKISVSNTVPKGVLWAPRQFEDADGNPLNLLMSGTPQKIGGGPRFNSTKVRLVPS